MRLCSGGGGGPPSGDALLEEAVFKSRSEPPPLERLSSKLLDISASGTGERRDRCVGESSPPPSFAFLSFFFIYGQGAGWCFSAELRIRRARHIFLRQERQNCDEAENGGSSGGGGAGTSAAPLFHCFWDAPGVQLEPVCVYMRVDT